MIVYDTLQPTLNILLKNTNSDPIDSLNNQKIFLQGFINSKTKLSNLYPRQDQDSDVVEISSLNKHSAFDNIMQKNDWSFNYNFKMRKWIEHSERKRSSPFVSILNNVDEIVIISAFGSKVELRILTEDWKLKFVQWWTFSDKELITAFDTKRTEKQIYFTAGTVNGVIYNVEFPTKERIIFDNHSDMITWLKFWPLPTKDIILSWSKDWSIRMFDIYNESQIAIYQDAYNSFLSVKWIAWHDSSEKFMSVWDRDGQDLVHFWFSPEHKSHHTFEDIYGFKQEENKNKLSSSFSEEELAQQNKTRVGWLSFLGRL